VNEPSAEQPAAAPAAALPIRLLGLGVGVARRESVRQVVILQCGAAAIAGLGFASSAALARVLGSAEFGLYALAMSIVSITLLVTDLGQSPGSVTLWAMAAAEHSRARAAAVGAYVLRISLTTGVLILVAALLFGPTIARDVYREPRLALLVQVLLGAGLFWAALRLPVAGLQATRRMAAVVGLEVGDIALRAALSVVAALAGLGAAGVVWGQALGAVGIGVAAVAVYAGVARRDVELPRAGEIATLALRGRVAMRRMVGFGLSVTVERDLRIVTNTVPVLLLGWIASTTDVADLRIATSYMQLPTLLYEPLTRVLLVSFPRLHLRGRAELGSAYWLSTWIASLGTLVVVLALAALAPWLIPLIYGHEYAASAPLALPLGVAAVAGAVQSTAIPLLRSLNRVWSAALLGGAMLLAAAVPLVWLIVRQGAPGAALAYASGAVLLAATAQWVCWRALRRPAPR
jgi:O-antigen/teichoic acid export membrane protein